MKLMEKAYLFRRELLIFDLDRRPDDGFVGRGFSPDHIERKSFEIVGDLRIVELQAHQALNLVDNALWTS